MPRGVKAAVDLDGLAARRAKLEAELAQLAEAERTAREAERDQGRKVLLAALGKVKIGAMDREDAKAIARALETMGGAELAARLAS